MEFIKKDISAGIELVGIPVDRFKTNLIKGKCERECGNARPFGKKRCKVS